LQTKFLGALSKNPLNGVAAGTYLPDFGGDISGHKFLLTVVYWLIYGGDEHYVLMETLQCAE
jgi:hypothetical protein